MKDYSSKVNNYAQGNGVYYSKDKNMWLDNFATPLEDEIMPEAKLVAKELIPAKYNITRKDLYAEGELRAMWRIEKPFEENYPVSWQAGFDSDTDQMRQNGWTITLEYNRATTKHKLCFRHKQNGLMARVHFQFTDTFIDIPCFYAIKNYKLKAAKFTEYFAQLTEDCIPELLEWIRDIKRAKVIDFVLEQNKQEIQTKVVELGNYLHNQQKEVA